MKFWEALKAMEEGKKVTKDEGNCYYFIEDNKLYLCTGELIGETFVSATDMLDYDWKIYDDRKEVSCHIKELYKAIDKYVETSWTDQDIESGFTDEFNNIANCYLTSFVVALDELNLKYKLDE